MNDTVMPIHILLVEDNPGDARLLHETLREAGDESFDMYHAETLAEAIDQLGGPVCCEVVLLDLSLPDCQGLETIRRVEAAAPAVPIVVLTGHADESLGLEALRIGAQDYLVKGQTDGRLLVRAIRYALERKRVQEALAQEHARVTLERTRLQAILDILPVGVFIADEKGRILHTNPAAQTIWGGQAPLTGAPKDYARDYQAWWPDTGRRVEAAECGLARALATGEICSAEEMEIETRDGQRKTILSYAVPFRNAEGHILGAAAVNVDITQRKQNLRELRALNETLEQRVAERTAVAERRASQLRALASELTQAEHRERRRLAQLLHDHLQQMLVAGRMSVGALRRRLDDADADRALAGLDELLDQSIEASRSMSMELSPPILYDAGLGAALEWLGRHMQDKHHLAVDVEVDPAADPADEDIAVLLFQAARELLFNVVKHAGVQQASVHLSLADAEQLRLEVSDRGVGFDPADLLHSGEAGSTGFGLFSVRERLELLGGHLTVDSSPGQGTRMLMAAPLRPAPTLPQPPLPMVPPHVPAAAGERPAPRTASQALRVLLADDHKILREGIAGLLADQLDIEVVAEASDGQMAVDLARQLRPDVVIMDVSMPHLTGVEATRIVTDEMPATRVIGLSMHEEADMATAMRNAGAVAYLSKGGPIDWLIAAIRGFCLLPQPPSQATPARGQTTNPTSQTN